MRERTRPTLRKEPSMPSGDQARFAIAFEQRAGIQRLRADQPAQREAREQVRGRHADACGGRTQACVRPRSRRDGGAAGQGRRACGEVSGKRRQRRGRSSPASTVSGVLPTSTAMRWVGHGNRRLAAREPANACSPTACWRGPLSKLAARGPRLLRRPDQTAGSLGWLSAFWVRDAHAVPANREAGIGSATSPTSTTCAAARSARTGLRVSARLRLDTAARCGPREIQLPQRR